MSTRIIGGTASGRRIKTPGGDATRPTSDRVREALFSSLEAALGSITGLRFLDLYAGSGAVGLEACSRGAGVVTCVEQDRRTSALIRDNARALGFRVVEVMTAPVRRILLMSPRAPYDVVFLDPPYHLPDEEVLADLTSLVAQNWLAEAALVVAERSRRGAELSWPTGLVGDREKKYGETLLWYGHAATGAS
ncbi:MAG: 16S rRNA (guanine(966)-N(2))-methyltransferase RsmD [Nocardioides sp.]